MRLITVILIFFLLVSDAIAQSSMTINGKNHSDCRTALPVNPMDTLICLYSPPDYGAILEFNGNSLEDSFYFEEEHHSIWYKFRIPYTGNLVFDIIPFSQEDDYDFLLYRYQPGKFCSLVKSKSIKPIRTNISRNDLSIQSRTGLSLQARVNFKNAGPGPSYSRAVKVKEGEIYYLVLDNVYDNGKGHKLIFRFLTDDGRSAVVYKITGKITNEKGDVPEGLEVVMEDPKTGIEVARAEVDPNTGKYRFVLPANFNPNKEYRISAYADYHFFTDKEVIPADQTNVEPLILQRLARGKSFKITNINFFPDSPMYLPECEPVLKRLTRVMQNNPKMKIQIEGHINGCTGDPEGRQLLSEARARTVYDYLVRNGIEPERMTTIGYGCRKMIYPNPQNEEEKKLNRRVEILILSY